MLFRRLASGFLAAALALPLLSSTGFADQAKPAAPAEAPAPKPIIKKYGTWSTRCDINPADTKQKECHAFVDVRIDDGKERLLYLGIGYLPQKPGELGAFGITPLGTALPLGLGIDIDDKTKFGGPFVYCMPGGCQADMELTADQVKALKTGKVATVLFRLVGRGDAKIPVKLDGLSAAIAALPKPTPVKVK